MNATVQKYGRFIWVAPELWDTDQATAEDFARRSLLRYLADEGLTLSGEVKVERGTDWTGRPTRNEYGMYCVRASGRAYKRDDGDA